MASREVSDLGRRANEPHQALIVRDADVSCSTAVVKAIANAERTDPVNLDFSLYDYIDPEALDVLYRHQTKNKKTSWEFTFTVEQFRVTITNNGYIEITEY